mgnify:CR=1 FL=1|jgi:hypothetical protein
MEKNVVYTNVAGVTLTKFDATLSFGMVVPTHNENGMVNGRTIVEQLEVFMSLEHLKVFSKILDNQIAIFEQREHIIPEIALGTTEEETK